MRILYGNETIRTRHCAVRTSGVPVSPAVLTVTQRGRAQNKLRRYHEPLRYEIRHIHRPKQTVMAMAVSLTTRKRALRRSLTSILRALPQDDVSTQCEYMHHLMGNGLLLIFLYLFSARPTRYLVICGCKVCMVCGICSPSRNNMHIRP